ncbi:MAG: formylmethanofuran dehydrogenase subunit B [Planctomycetota bacterium]|jgi:formylmethanofuran dehydrogenase subunit B
MTREFHNVACTVCGCVCDDLKLRVDGKAVVPIENACSLAQPWFARLAAVESAVEPVPVATIHGRSTSREAALFTAAEILRKSRAPLIYGLARSSTPGQRAAVVLADQLGAVIDTTASVCHGPSIMAIQRVGESTSTLGEVRERADLVVFWGADPQKTHPRHFERYSGEPQSRFLPGGRDDRTVVVVDSRETETARLADRFIQIPQGRDFEMISALRMLIDGQGIASGVDCGLPREELNDLANLLKGCRYGVVFFGLGIAQQSLGHLVVESLLQLVAELNAHTRFTARRLRIPGDVSGADSVLCWQTGYPFAVDLGRGYPRYNPGEFSAGELLERREVDACVIVGSDSVTDFSEAAMHELSRLPTIVLDYPHAECAFQPTVNLTTAVYGIHAAGTVYRMDEVPIPQRKLVESEFPTDENALGMLSQLLRS